MVARKETERCIVTINGVQYEDWESVWVHIKYQMPPPEFRLTVSEGEPLAPSWVAVRIRPGDACDITLGGVPAIHGYVNHRQVSYAAHQHGVLIAGRGMTQDLQDSSIWMPGTSGQFRDYNWDQIARKILAPYGIGLEYVGGMGDAMIPFRDVQIMPGESPLNFLDRLARMRKITLGESQSGNLVALNQPIESGTSLIEGKNILEANCIIEDVTITSPVVILGQENGTDERWAAEVAQQIYERAWGATKRWRPFVGLAERTSAGNEDLKRRWEYEVANRDGETVYCEITVYGWLCAPGQLWWPGMEVYVHSPMLIMDRVLAIKECTFTQDNQQGTRTMMLLVKPGALGGQHDLSGAGSP